MEYRRMGLSGVMVSTLGIGTNQFGRKVDDRGAEAIAAKALELGINFIDTAESYASGASEELVGKAFGSRRNDFVIATKAGPVSEPTGRLSRRQLMRRLEGSLRRLGMDHVDLYYLHFPDPGTPLEESLRALDDMVRSGKVIYPAVSNYPAWQVVEALAISDRNAYAKPVVVQNHYNMLVREPEAELLPACLHFGLSLVPHTPLAEGFLTGKYESDRPVVPGVRGHDNQRFKNSWMTDEHFADLKRFKSFAAEHDHAIGDLAIAWLLAQPLVCSVIAGVTSVEQLEVNAAATAWKLEPEKYRKL